MTRKWRYKINTPGPMSVTPRSTPRRQRPIHAHAPTGRVPIPIIHGSITLAVIIEIFSTPPVRITTRGVSIASVSIRGISIPRSRSIALRDVILLRRLRIRVTRRGSRSRSRCFTPGERDIIPHRRVGARDRARRGFWRGFWFAIPLPPPRTSLR